MWLSRFLLHRVAESFDIGVTFEPKPITGDWNGSGAHCNFSTNSTRQAGGMSAISTYVTRLGERHSIHVNAYGIGNGKRLTGQHETASMTTFKFGVADRSASIRIPRITEKNNCGYLEDRRPASNCDPYVVTGLVADTTILEGSHGADLIEAYNKWLN